LIISFFSVYLLCYFRKLGKMIIKIAGLSDSLNFLEFSGNVKELKLEEPFRDNYSLSLSLDKSHSQLILSASLKLKADFICDRCGAEFTDDVNTEFKQVYLFGVAPEDTKDTEIVYLPFDTDKINLGNDLYDYAQLSIPMKRLCNDDCKGFCQKCHANLNVEKCVCVEEEIKPQWEELQKLKNKLKK